jgi:hypothetical protein
VPQEYCAHERDDNEFLAKFGGEVAYRLADQFARLVDAVPAFDACPLALFEVFVVLEEVLDLAEKQKSCSGNCGCLVDEDPSAGCISEREEIFQKIRMLLEKL